MTTDLKVQFSYFTENQAVFFEKINKINGVHLYPFNSLHGAKVVITPF